MCSMPAGDAVAVPLAEDSLTRAGIAIVQQLDVPTLDYREPEETLVSSDPIVPDELLRLCLGDLVWRNLPQRSK